MTIDDLCKSNRKEQVFPLWSRNYIYLLKTELPKCKTCYGCIEYGKLFFCDLERYKRYNELKK